MAIIVDPSNAAAAQGWDGPNGDFWTENADMFDAGVARYTAPFFAAAAIEPGSRVLDVGCGNGQTTRDAARLAHDGTATGLDLSSRMLALARERAAVEGVANVRFEQADAQIADLGENSYDRIISRTGVMFFGDPVAAFRNLARSLAPGGRMALAVWQDIRENEWLSSFFAAAAAGRDIAPPPPDRPGPFGLSNPDTVRSVLTAAGFAEPQLTAVHELMYYGADVATAERFALGTIAGLLAELDDATRASALGELRASLQAHMGPDGVTYRSGMWIITARPA
ncbi:class I SAM-dependent methyltransferase [Pseudonocardia sp. TRM90224]|uniref:class I SAM-dependent methyltransferase n=1 Tax=Pseudonocardia sp. TRM90224 TaxID=2812678 RepID=UPI001E41C5B7|nr:class I SAM-dependent methyltransferase [Pseudonocardia sp. TRM90224]